MAGDRLGAQHPSFKSLREEKTKKKKKKKMNVR
jgi:hypothetical protein